MTLPALRQILHSHFQEKMQPYFMSNLPLNAKVTKRHQKFLMRVLVLHQKIVFAVLSFEF